MSGPPPKDVRARRRFNTPAGGEWVDLGPIDKSVIPTLPPRSGEAEWSADARATWESWGRDPVTTQWTPADTGYALDTLRLVDLFARSPRANFAAEIRLRMDGLGLTPKGRRNLRWRVVEVAEVVEQTPASQRTSARRRRLRAVAEPREAFAENNDDPRRSA